MKKILPSFTGTGRPSNKPGPEPVQVAAPKTRPSWVQQPVNSGEVKRNPKTELSSIATNEEPGRKVSIAVTSTSSSSASPSQVHYTGAPKSLDEKSDAIDHRGASDGSRPRSITSVSTWRPLETSISVRAEGMTLNIGENATIFFKYGTKFTQSNDEHHALDDIILGLTRSHNADYDMVANATRGPCTPGTRISVLEKLVNWCNSPDLTLYWMSGMMGTGKTTLLFSICHLLEQANLLGASFFCSRSLPDCRNTGLIFSTIAFQLAQRYPAFGEPLAEMLHNDPDVLKRGLDVQLRKLIIDPWREKKAQLPKHLVVVIDALDECDERHSQVLQVLFDNVTELPFKVLVASRPEISIRDTIMTKDPTILSKFNLHEVEEDMVRADIIKYLESQLSQRTSADTIRVIADLAGSLFIYAATLAKLFATGRVNIPRCIQVLQSTTSTNNRSKTAIMASLDALYLEILSNILSDTPLEDEAQDIKDILYTVICAYEPLTQRGLAEIWGIGDEEVVRRLDLLRSVLFISENPEHPITVFHASFPEFILDPSRSKEFSCESRGFNLTITARCLGLMNSRLHQNICNLVGSPQNPFIPPDVVKLHITPGLQYAVIYVADHWKLSEESKRGAVLLAAAQEFLTAHLLHWLECLSLLRKLSIAVLGLEKLEEVLDKDTELSSLVYHFLRFILLVYDLVEDTPIEIYSSALIWTPTDCPLRTYYDTKCKEVDQAIRGLPTSWSRLDRVIEIHTSSITSMTVSHDGNRIISGSWDATVRIWDIRRQLEECVLSGHTKGVSSVAAFRDGNRVLSGSYDNTVRVWNIATRQAIFTLDGSSSVLGIAISSDDISIASGHKDGLIRIWDATNGHLVHSLEGHTDSVPSLSFFPNTSSLVSASEDGTARIWNVRTGETKHVLHHQHGISSVACSPAGDKIVTGSLNRPAQVWDPSGKELQGFYDHPLLCFAFLPDGQRIVTGTYDNILPIFDTNTGDTVDILPGTGNVSSIAVFPDCQKIASSAQNRISIWSLRGGGLVKGVNENVDESRLLFATETISLAFSSDGQWALSLPTLRIIDMKTLEPKIFIDDVAPCYAFAAVSATGRKVAAANGDSIEVWELTGDGVVGKHFSLKGHTDMISSISFSSDASKLLSTAASQDCTVRVWDVTTGDEIHVLNHSAFLWRATFSHDSSRIVSSVLETMTMHVWDAQSGQELLQFHTVYISPTFSLDDRYIIASFCGITNIMDSYSGEFIHEYTGYRHWTTFDNGSSYALRDDGWVCYFTGFGAEPHRVIWIPSLYRPAIDEAILSGPLFTSSLQGVQLCLPTNEGLVILLMSVST